MPLRNTSGNSRPLAVCSVIICTQSSDSLPWPSPDSSTACDRKLCSGGRSALGFKAARGTDQFLEVLDPGLAAIGLVLLVMFDQPAVLDHVIDLFVQRQVLDRRAQPLDELQEQPRRTGRAAPGPDPRCHRQRRAQCAGGAPQRAARAARGFANGIDAARADAARRQIDDALERGVIVAIGDQAQVRERVLDFGALEESQAPVHAVGHAHADQKASSKTRDCALER